MVILYGKDSCAPCKQLKQFFKLKNVTYEYRDVGEAVNAEEAYRISGLRSVPIVRVDDDVVGGYNLSALIPLLTKA